MIEVKELYKTYRPKRGVPVRAIDRVSLTLPDTGMVFLLGKSGSGKSTLLNLLGGLDRYDSGDIVINGTSTREFRQVHFDSYRNTYVGFIFQEYNLIDEFTVGANIALAIELQGHRAENEEINAILQEVDLVGYGHRRTNELSGGQKQRVAIARALVKQPQIIMADEPSGALDEATGRAVFETLKRLSEKRLVLVVSHDREFAETYGDRIIELADGRVIDDRTANGREEVPAEVGLTFTEEAVEIPSGYELTEEDRLAINAYLRDRAGGRLRVKAATTRFAATAAQEPLRPTQAGAREFRLIKSRLPLRSAFRIGANALGHKRVRLVFTILLSVVAFILFGLSDTIASYDPIRTMTASLVDSNVRHASLVKMKDYSSFSLTKEDIDALRAEIGLPFVGVYAPVDGMSLSGTMDTESEGYAALGMLTVGGLSGFAEVSEAGVREMGYEFKAGRYPDGSKNEIALSLYIYELYHAGGYAAPGTATYQAIDGYDDLIGKTLALGDGEVYTVTGVFDSGFDMEHYALLREDVEEMTTEEALATFILLNEFSYEADYGLTGAALVGEGFLSRYLAAHPHLAPIRSLTHFESENEEAYFQVHPNRVATDTRLPSDGVIWLDGTAKDSLAKGEIVIPLRGAYADELADGATTEQWTAFLQSHARVEAMVFDDENFAFLPQGEYRIVGFTTVSSEPKNSAYTLYCAEEDYAAFVEDTGVFAYATAPMPVVRAEIDALVRYVYTGEEGTGYELQNGVSYQISITGSILAVLGAVFFYIGIGFAIFAALLFSNFIATSIIYKRREIGILRAIGSRSADVFRIFFAEGFVIAMISFAASALGSGILCALINGIIRQNTGILVTLLTFGIRQVLLLLGISLGVALIASFLPVWRIASKRPIDAIRDR